MPLELAELLKKTVSTLSPNFTQKDDHSTAHDVIDLDADSQSIRTPARPVESRVDEVGAESGGHKRGRDVQGFDRSERHSKRARQLSGDERRLMPNYKAGPDAIRISLGSQDDVDVDWIPRGAISRMPNKANSRRGPKPMDTLSEGKPRMQQGTNSLASRTEQSISANKLSSPFSQGKRGSDVELWNDFFGSGQQHMLNHESKKRRFEYTPLAADTPNHPVNFMDSRNEGRPQTSSMAAKTARSPFASTSQRPSSGASPTSLRYYAMTEFDNVSQSAKPNKERQRKHRAGDGDQQFSSPSVRSLSPGASNGVNWPLRDYERGIMGASPSTRDRPETQSSYIRWSPPRHPGQPAEKYMTNDIPVEPRRPDSRIRHNGIRSAFNSHRFTSNQESKANEGSSRPVRSNGSREAQEVTEYYVKEHMQPAPHNLSSTFRRDHQPPSESSRRLKARERMKASSDQPSDRTSGQRFSVGSEDELSTEVIELPDLPELPPARVDRSTYKDRKHQPRRPPSSLHKATIFEADATDSTSVRGSQADAHQELASNRASQPIPDEVRIPVELLLSKCCLVQDGHIELVWDAELKCFYVEYNGEQQQVPGEETAFRLTSSDVSFAWFESVGTQLVHLKGSKNGFGTGNTLIEFTDTNGKSKFLSHLMSSAQLRDRHRTIDDGAIRRRLDTLGSELTEAFRQKTNQRAVASITGRSSFSGLRPQLPSQILRPDQERIKYERDELEDPHPPPRAERKPLDKLLIENTQQNQPRNAETPFQFIGSRRSGRQTQMFRRQESETPPPQEVRWTHVNKPAPWDNSITYPAQGPGRVTIDFSDLERLDDGEMLNDNIVTYALRRIEEKMPPEQKQDVYVFNSYFYSSLSSKNNRKAFNYDAVKRWTRNRDLFTVPYIVVPINVELHWFVAIICNLPTLQRRLSGNGDDDNDDDDGHATTDSDNIVVAPSNFHAVTSDFVNDSAELSHATTPITDEVQRSDARRSSSLNEKLEHEGPEPVEREGESLLGHSKNTSPPPTNFFASKKSKRRPVGRKYSPDEPVIITLDSLGIGRSAEVRFLKQYIRAEALDKRAMNVEASDLLGITAKGIPVQSNFSDCGLYTIGYIEEFAKDPRRFVSRILSRDMDEEDFKDFTPSRKRAEIRDSLLQLNKEQTEEQNAAKVAKQAHKRALAQAESVAQSQAPAKDQDRPTSSADAQVLQSRKEPKLDEQTSSQSPLDGAMQQGEPVEATPTDEPVGASSHAKNARHEPLVDTPVDDYNGERSMRDFTTSTAPNHSQMGNSNPRKDVPPSEHAADLDRQQALNVPDYERLTDIRAVQKGESRKRSALRSAFGDWNDQNPVEVGQSKPRYDKSKVSSPFRDQIDLRAGYSSSSEPELLVRSADEGSQVSAASEIPDSQEKPSVSGDGGALHINLEF